MRALKIFLFLSTYLFSFIVANAQNKQTTPPQTAIEVPKTIPQIKEGIEKSYNPILYTRDILKKKYKIDTVVVMNTLNFQGIADSLAYHGKPGKVYGPFLTKKRDKYLVEVLAQEPSTFNRISQVFIDTTVFAFRIADSLSKTILNRLQNGQATFEDMAKTYSMGGEGATNGDLGWIARGHILPEIEQQILLHKKGDVFIVWSRTGVHIIKKTDNMKQDIGYALLLRIFL
jgi:hypothetical protein